ncbi:DUF7007 domain-containing protein [Sphingomonas solaris]|uniref:DUF7007 domain-containing protein n=1 Tax=Alterirhizorhabdus solaris TaxID=2529389 RepID=A0A558RCA5_9SPHN|nr:hypothetical protein [Sphingomonas solaris]TVV76968.1 hypothetical protein FOY91_02695 [Sphingomonas solaris]
MPAFNSTPAPDLTPWGKADTATERLPGVFQVTTPSHGGFILYDERQAAMPDALRLDAPAYEEDVNWSLAVIAFAEELAAAGDHLTKIEIDLAHQTARNWMPDRYAAFTGKPVEPRDSYILRAILAYEALIGEIVVVSAFGDWADWVPAGKTGVIGRKLASVNHLGHPTYEGPEHRALVEATRYKASASPNSFAAISAEIMP